MKNTHLFGLTFQVLKVFLQKNFRYRHQFFWFLLFYINSYSVNITFHNFIELHSTLSKKGFHHRFSFSKGFTQTTTTLLSDCKFIQFWKKDLFSAWKYYSHYIRNFFFIFVLQKHFCFSFTSGVEGILFWNEMDYEIALRLEKTWKLNEISYFTMKLQSFNFLGI